MMTTGLLLSAALAAGFFGSAHCIAMCGAIVLLFEGQGPERRLARRIVYNTGRMLFYVTLGIAGGASGALLMSGFTGGLGFLRVIAGVLIVIIGMNLAFDWRALRFLEQAGAVIWKRVSPLARHVVPVSTLPRALGAGFLWGALPCGLVYSAVALATTSGSALAGGLVMFTFWLGTLPTLLVAGASARRLHDWKSQLRLRRIAGAVMILFGLVSLALPLRHLAGDEHGAHMSYRSTGSDIAQQFPLSLATTGEDFAV